MFFWCFVCVAVTDITRADTNFSFFHDAARDKEWKKDMKQQEKSLKEFVKETVANSESRIMAELKIMEAKRKWW